MIIGAQKCGTTNLAAQLAGHADVAFCKIKEPGYFHQHADWQSGLEQYHALFTPQPGQICGEASTMYTFFPEWPETATRLFAYNPDLKLIYIMRNPVERVISNYTHNLVRGIDTVSPEQTVLQDPGYINRSRYGVQIRPYLELFPRQNILLLIFEEYVADQAGTLRQVAEFLEISSTGYRQVDTVEQHKTVGEYQIKYEFLREFVGSPFFQRVRTKLPTSLRQAVKRQVSNKVEETPVFSPQLRATLQRLLADDVRTIEEVMGRRIACWHAN